MGDRRTGDRALGRIAVKRWIGLLPVALLVTGCGTVADIAGLATGAVAGGATANPAVGYAVAVGTAAAADAAFKWVSRRRQGAEQDAIAAVAGGLPEGKTAPWAIRHDLPFGNEHGEVRVVRDIVTPLATCKEIVFSVIDEPPEPPAHYGTTLCHQAETWKWALAEPAVPRWGYLQ
jgi:hypothetical protein